MCLRPVARMYIHGHGVQLLQTGHGLQQQHDQPATLDRLNRPRQQIRRERLKVLKDTHSVSVSEDLLRLLVVNIADVRERDEEFEGVLGVGLSDAALDLLLDLGFALLAVTGEAEQLVLVGPENGFVLLRVGAAKNVVEVQDYIFASIADDDKEGPLLLLYGMGLDLASTLGRERIDAGKQERVLLLEHHCE